MIHLKSRLVTLLQNADEDDAIAIASLLLGVGSGIVLKLRAGDPATASDLYQQILATIPRDEIDRQLGIRSGRINPFEAPA